MHFVSACWLALGFWIGRYVFGRRGLTGTELRTRLGDLRDPVVHLRNRGLL